ncbi:MAG: hypothetical protein E6G93_16205 [Alphaproteobacteria bacterium]|nr:MAG: hypothetical protein E6G93_16205 [Alphaproteobacteria bacterium]
MTQPDLIIFDCDGVLVDSEVLSCRCLSKVLASYGIDLGLDQARDLFLGRSTTAVFENYQALGHAIPEQFSGELRAGVRAAFLSALRPIDGVGVVLEGLQIPHCVASSSDIERVWFAHGRAASCWLFLTAAGPDRKSRCGRAREFSPRGTVA